MCGGVYCDRTRMNIQGLNDKLFPYAFHRDSALTSWWVQQFVLALLSAVSLVLQFSIFGVLILRDTIFLTSAHGDMNGLEAAATPTQVASGERGGRLAVVARAVVGGSDGQSSWERQSVASPA